jgi:cation diffusion facilitator CzcD-associated flavoprotein CzcO
MFDSDRREPEALIVGAGIGGLAVARELKRRGIDDFIVLDRGATVGGVWRENTYPDVACDTPVDLYSFSYHLGERWSTNYAPGHEIHQYLQDMAQRFGLAQHVLLNTEVSSARWRDELGRWQVEAADGRSWQPRFVIWAGGLLSRPNVPDLPGREAFSGTIRHTAAWGDGVELRDKSVAVVGGGATSIQVLPYVANVAKTVYAFIRTPSHVLPKPEEFYDDDDRRRFAADPSLQQEGRAKGMQIANDIALARFPMNDEFIAGIEAQWRTFIEAEVHDPAVRALLTPSYRFSCRRPLVSNVYYKTFNRPNVRVIRAGAAAMTADAILASDGRTFEVDSVILATGYDAAGMLGDLNVIGRHGQDLAQLWRDTYPEAYLGTLVKGFPNLFLINGPNVGAPSVTEMLEAQSAYAGACIELVKTQNGASIEVTPDAQDAFNRDLQERFAKSVMLLGGCTSWYRSAGGTGAVFSHWPGTLASFRDEVARIRLADVVVAPARQTTVVSA